MKFSCKGPSPCPCPKKIVNVREPEPVPAKIKESLLLKIVPEPEGTQGKTKQDLFLRARARGHRARARARTNRIAYFFGLGHVHDFFLRAQAQFILDKSFHEYASNINAIFFDPMRLPAELSETKSVV